MDLTAIAHGVGALIGAVQASWQPLVISASDHILFAYPTWSEQIANPNEIAVVGVFGGQVRYSSTLASCESSKVKPLLPAWPDRWWDIEK